MGRLSRVYVGLIKRLFRRRFALAHLTKVPLVGSTIRKTLFDGDDMMVLPKDAVAMESVKRTVAIEPDISVEPQDVVLPSAVVEEFIRRAEDHFVMDFCICRKSNECEDYPRDLGCLFLGKAVKNIDKGLGRLVTAEEAVEHIRRCREAGLVHLIGRNKLDSIWLSTGPKEELMTVCSCCPCCCLWKMLPELSQHISERVIRMPGVDIRVDTDLCTGCGSCTDGVCFVNAVSVVDGKVRIDGAMCRGCGRCTEACPASAIHLDISDRAYVDAAIGRLEGLVRLGPGNEERGNGKSDQVV